MKKEEYKQKNEAFLQELATQKDIQKLPCGIFYRIITSGKGQICPNLHSIVSVHYRGTLINGKEFDNSYQRNCPEAFRLNEVIDGWQQALQLMHVGDKWIIYIPYQLGYGKKACGPIPAYSTLIFEVELLSIG